MSAGSGDGLTNWVGDEIGDEIGDVIGDGVSDGVGDEVGDEIGDGVSDGAADERGDGAVGKPPASPASARTVAGVRRASSVPTPVRQACRRPNGHHRQEVR